MIQCLLCPNYCFIAPNAKGRCRARININDTLYSLVYGKPCAVHIDPIEKKPMYHFLPQSKAFSIATAGCCLSCKYCQNWQISQAEPENAPHYEMPPDVVLRKAKETGCASIAYTYTDPIIFFEYMLDTAKRAQKQGIKNVLVTCGYINQEPMEEVTPYIDGANIDLKGFTEQYYKDITGGSLKPVLNAIEYMHKAGVIVELTTLIVPTLNDDMGMIKEMCSWIHDAVSPDTPLHFSRFYPHYKLKQLPQTPYETLIKARSVAQDVGLHYVYIGNVYQAEGQTTYCSACGSILIERRGYFVFPKNLKNGTCGNCGHTVYGLF